MGILFSKLYDRIRRLNIKETFHTVFEEVIMKILRFSLWLFAFLWMSSSLYAQDGYWQQWVHYKIDVTLDAENKMLTGRETIVYKNNSPDVLEEIYLHLYPNAFKDENTTMAREAKADYQMPRFNEEDNGYIDIHRMQITRREEMIDWASIPVAAYDVDETILHANLPDPLPPGGELVIDIEFTEKIRRFLGRAGYRGNQFDMAQWYPKLVVYDEDGWHPDKFHTSGEFYGEFGIFDVSITLPFDYIVAATGKVVEGDPGWKWVKVDTSLGPDQWIEEQKKMKEAIQAKKEDGETRTVTFRAEKVHDFAWLASPDFLYEYGEWDGIPIHVLYRSHVRGGWTKQVVERGIRVIEFLSTKFGRYPYPQLSITHGLLGGGMEYPMLVMNAGPGEGLISHEVGHIYFYGMLASDELDEAWMDEGFTTYQERWYQETLYGPMGQDMANLPSYIPSFARSGPFSSYRENAINGSLNYMNSGFYEPISKPAHEFRGGYGVNAYTRGALFHEMLRYILGEDNWETFCHEYFDRWKFKHVNEARLREVAEDVSGMDLRWFFDQWLRGTPLVDYALDEIRKMKNADGTWRTEVDVVRKSDGIMPVEVEVTLPDGSTEVKRWDGVDSKGTVVFETAGRTRNIKLDPRDQVMDNNRSNNGTSKIRLVTNWPWLYWYNPRDVYTIFWQPSVWYNDVDGGRLGLIFRGNIRRTQNRFNLGLWYGTKSKEVDYAFRLADRTGIGNGFVSYNMFFKKIEGRLNGHLGVLLQLANHWYRPPRFNIRVGLDYWERLDDDADYTFRKWRRNGETYRLDEWDEGRVGKFYVDLEVDPRGQHWRSRWNVRLEVADELIGSDVTFGQLSGSGLFRWGSPNSDNIAFRLFGGTSFGKEAPPTQEHFFADGAGPLERFNRYYLRSVGAFPAGMNYHHPGDGNLRGYFNQHRDVFLASQNIAAINVEATKSVRLPLIGRLFTALRMRTDLSVFYDFGTLGQMVGGGDVQLQDAGLGFHIRGRLPNYQQYTLRFDFPIWLSDPEPGEESFTFRWLFSYRQAL